MKTQRNISKKLLAGLLSSAMILGASGTSGFPFGLNAVAETPDSGEPAVQAEPRLLELPFVQEETGGDFKDIDEDCELRWHYKDNVLTISGIGDMPNWEGLDWSGSDVTPTPERPWENFKDQITKIVIEDGVTSIGDYAFCNLHCHDYFGYVLEVEIGSGVKKIGSGAFYNSCLTEVVIPENVETIGNIAFGRNWNLKGAFLTKNTSFIQGGGGSGSFSGSNLSDISSKIISLESYSGDIEDTALSWSYDAKTHTLEITGSGAIPNYNHPNPDHSENDRPWQDLRRYIANIVIGNGVTSIGKYAFCDIWGHELLDQPLNITFGSGVETIDEYAFANCYMTEVVIPANVKTIGSQAFGSNWVLNSIKLLSQDTVYESDSFTGSSGKDLSSIITQVGTIGGKFSDWEVTLTQDENKNELDTPKTVNPFPDNELSWSYDLETHTLTISGEGDMPDWVAGSDQIVKQNEERHWQNRPWHDYKDQIQHIVIENGVTSIGDYAFCHFDGNVTIDIPEGVTEIGHSAFYESDGLKEITIPASVKTIVNEAFWHCRNLEKVTFAEGSQLETICSSGFRDCRSLNNITLPNSLKEINTAAFMQCASLTEITIPENVTNLGTRAFENCTDLDYVKFEGTDQIPKLGDGVFAYCPCVANGKKGLIINSCAVLDDYRSKAGLENDDPVYDSNGNIIINPYDYKDNIDKTHNVSYTDEGGAVITETCYREGCAHEATATLSTKRYHTYTGSEIKPVINTYSDNWYGTGEQRPADTKIEYTNNVKVGIAEATLTLTDDMGATATSRINFEILPVLELTIYPKDWEGEYDGEPHTIDVDTNMPTHVSPIKITYSNTEDGTYEEDKPSYTDVGDYTIWCMVETPDGQVVKDSATVKIKAKPITDDMVEVEPDPNGGDPTVTVKDGDTTLTPGTDYTVNITPTPGGEPGEYTITVTGTGNYTDDVTKTIPEGISAEGWRGQYDGEEHRITVKGKPEGSTVKYSETKDGPYEDEDLPYTDVGTYTVYYEVTKTDNTTERGSATIQITPKPLTEDMVTVTPDPDGGEPTVTVEDGDTPLVEGKDYKVTITSTPNPNGGTPEYTVTVKNIINANYEGEVTKNVLGGVTAEGWNDTYDGAPHSITVKLPDGVTPDQVTIRYGTDPDHVTSPTNPEYTDVGENTVYFEVELPDGQVATGSAKVIITPKSLTDDMVEVIPDPDGGEPTVIVKDGDKPLVKDTDYTVTITTTTDPDGGDPKYEITVTGKGNYEDSVTKPWYVIEA